MSYQNDIERLKDKIYCHEMTAAQANVEMVRIERFRLIRGRVPIDVRKALNVAVKEGILMHLKKDGFKPEVYFHPEFDHLAIAARNKAERETVAALAAVAGFPQE